MINLVIADDENRVCRLINALGEWEKLGIHVSGLASNGLEALELVKREHADILITDIRMPGCNGLELIEEVRRISENIKIIIISGYANFEYAQTAIKAGVSDYLLKPINKNALNETLQRLVEELNSAKKETTIIENIQNELQEQIGKTRSTLLGAVLDHSLKVSSLEELKEKYHFQAGDGYFQTVIGKFDSTLQNIPEEEIKSFLWDRFEASVNRDLKKYVFDMVIWSQERWMYGILSFPEDTEQQVKKVIRSAFNEMIAGKEFFHQGEITFAFGKLTKDPKELCISMDAAAKNIGERLLVGTGKVYEQDFGNAVLLGRRLLNQFSGKIDKAMESLDVEAFAEGIDRLKETVLDTPGVHGWEIYELVLEAGNLLLTRAEDADRLNIQKKFREQCLSSTSVSELFEVLKHIASEQMHRLIAVKEDDLVRPVRLAKNYIRQHYQEPLTLEEVADKVGLTQSYFSSLFKKETQVGFARYLMSERMEAAKEMLRETNLSVKEICYQVGYHDVKHFTHIFEKSVGVKPAAYRKLYG